MQQLAELLCISEHALRLAVNTVKTVILSYFAGIVNFTKDLKNCRIFQKNGVVNGVVNQ